MKKYSELMKLAKEKICKNKKKIIISVILMGILAVAWSKFERTEMYGDIGYSINQYFEQKERDKEWGHLEYSGDEVLESIKTEMSVEEYADDKFNPNATLEDLDKERLNLYTAPFGNGVFMNKLGMFGDVSFQRLSLYSFENTSIGGVDLALNVHDLSVEVIRVAEELLRILLPTGHVELIEALNDADYRGGTHEWDGRRVDVEFHAEGITFLFYGKEK